MRSSGGLLRSVEAVVKSHGEGMAAAVSGSQLEEKIKGLQL